MQWLPWEDFGEKKTLPGFREGFGEKRNRRRPTLPHSCPCSTIGAEELNFRVRDGNGCCLLAKATENLKKTQIIEYLFRLGNTFVLQVAEEKKIMAKPHGLLVPVSSMRYRISTSGLSTQSSSWGPYQVNPVRVLILERVSRLDAFSGYPFRT